MLDAFWTGVGVVAAHWGLWMLAGVLLIVILRYLGANRRHIGYVKSVLYVAKEIMGQNLGGKTGAVIDIWLEGLDKVSDGEFTNEEMLETFTQFIKVKLQEQNIALTPSEMNTVREAADVTMQMLDVQSKETQQAVRMLMAQ